MNADATKGEVRVELLVDGHPLPGYTSEDCEPITADSVSTPVLWKGGTGQAQSNVPVQIAFHMKDARLYGFTFTR